MSSEGSVQPNLFADSAEESILLEDFAEKAYLNYSMYVILDRALPHISDGLKPVQRRIIYAMSELRLKSTEKFKKSARTVGDVIGKFHPHGDAAAYEAMVLMAQPFSYRYPIIHGQGNWGSPDDPKSFAAMRYTECKFTPYAQTLLEELSKDKIYWQPTAAPTSTMEDELPDLEPYVSKGTVDWVPNFDGTIDEPQRLPAQLPNILLNGSTGIAVGMTTSVPPHNMREVAKACVELLRRPTISTEKLCEFIPGPDFPTKAIIITPRKDLVTTYKTGNGSVRMRAAWKTENKSIVIHALPHQVSGSRIMEQIAKQMLEKKLPMIADLRDEGDEETPTRLVLELRNKQVDCERLMGHLFKTTELEKSYRIHLNLIGLDGKPKVHNLKDLLSDWLKFRNSTILRRLQGRLDYVTDRLEILDGLFTVYLNLDEVIRIIRNEDQPKLALMRKLDLTNRQADAVLEIRLRQLAKLEEIKIRKEKSALRIESNELEEVIRSPKKLKRLTIQEIQTAAKKHGDDRCSTMQEMGEVQAFSVDDFTPVEPITVFLSVNGWVRTGKGHRFNFENLNYRSGDRYLSHAIGKSNETLIFMDATGRIYTVNVRDLPSVRTLGDPLTKFVTPPKMAQFTSMFLGPPDCHCLLASSEGYGFVSQLKQLASKTKFGKIALAISEGTPFPIERVDDFSQSVVVITNKGRLLTYSVKQLPVRSRGKGVKLINIPTTARNSGESVKIVKVLSQDQTMKIHAGKRFVRLNALQREGYRGDRTLRGKLLPRGYQRVGSVEIE